MLSKYRTISTISKSKNREVSIVEEVSSGKIYILKQVLNLPTLIPNKKFYKEINIVSSLEHPTITKPVSFSISEESTYIIYDLLEGTTLSEFLKKTPKLKIEDAFHITIQLLDALSYIHLRGIIHCDINPHNIFITKENKVKLLDFCSAMTIDEASRLSEGIIIGTFPYLSPEQTGLTRFKIDNRSDLYCVAIIFYQMLAGELPFSMKNESLKDLLDASIKRKIEPIKFLPKIHNEILLKGLKPSPEERYQTAEGMLYDIEKVKENVLKGETKDFIIGVKDNYFSVLRKKSFIIREKESSYLYSLLEKLSNGKSASALIYGRSGIGKTSLINGFIKSLDKNYSFAIAKGNRLSISQPFAIIRQLIIDYFNKISELPPEEIEMFKNKLQIGSENYSGIVFSIVPEIGRWFEKISEIDIIEREKEIDRILYVMSTFLAKVATLRKTIFFIDDFQWCDRFSLLIILRLIEEKVPIFIIGCYRITINNPSIICFDKDLTKVNFDKTINLREFSIDDVLQFIRAKFSSVENESFLAEILYRKTDGIPYVLEEALRYLILQGKIVFENSKWKLDPKEIEKLPEKIDAISIVLDKYKKLEEDEKRFLKISSLIEGAFKPKLIQKILELDEAYSLSIINKLTAENFIYPSYFDKYTFVHDRVQEAIATTIDNREKISIYEKIGEFYAEAVKNNQEMVFQTAEVFCKTENITAAILWCYKAALYAIEKSAFFDSIRYLRNIIILSDKIEKSKLEEIVNLTEVKILLGKSLMITGANEQALGIFAELRTESSLTDKQLLEIQYNIGEIYKNMGDFEKSSLFFLQTLSSHKIKIPKNRLLLFFLLLIAMLKQLIFSLGIVSILPKRKDERSKIVVRILNELAYSLYFQDMLKAFYVHYLSLNYSTLLIDCSEKAQSYLLHTVPLYQMFFKKKAIKYFYKALNIAKRIKRKDTEALALSFGGLLHFFNAEWKKSEKLLCESNEFFKLIGDINNPFVNIEHIRKISFLRGDIYKASILTENLIEISKKMGSDNYHTCLLLIKTLFDLLIKNSFEEQYYLKILHNFKRVDSLLLHVDIGSYIINIELENGEYNIAYQRAKHLFPLILKRCINSEYQVKFSSLFCSLICKELIARKKGEIKIENSFLNLKLELLSHLIFFWLSTICYPAYKGAFYRVVGWFLALNHLKRSANIFFKRAIQCHHKLDMKYEEACSLRDYAMFLDDFCNLHGEARDYYEKAYKLFKNCGVKLETDRLEPIVGSSNISKKAFVEFKDCLLYTS
ncbi:MAG: protein kinase, partial [Chitinispirillaceae bacterium]|nr:protein kinase [Chitinispirillaceae bacterium]